LIKHDDNLKQEDSY